MDRNELIVDGRSEVPAGAIGSDVWPGTARLAEECSELLQVLGKLQACPSGDHPDGGDLLQVRLGNELADVLAAARFVIAANGMDSSAINHRSSSKFSRFLRWHTGARDRGKTAAVSVEACDADADSCPSCGGEGGMHTVRCERVARKVAEIIEMWRPPTGWEIVSCPDCGEDAGLCPAGRSVPEVWCDECARRLGTSPRNGNSDGDV